MRPVQGVAYRSSLTFLQRAWWIVPALVVTASDRWEPRTVVLASLAAGLVWQVLYRRDLADRLAFLAFVSLVPVAVLLLEPRDAGRFEAPLTLGVTMLVVGLVLAEHVLRVRDDRRAVRAARARGSVPTGP